MANLGDRDLSEKGRLIAITAMTMASVALTTIVIHVAQAWWIVDFINRESELASAILHMALWGGVMFMFANIRPILRGAMRAGRFAPRAIGIGLFYLVRRAAFATFTLIRLILTAPVALVRLVLGPGYEVLRLRIVMAAAPALTRSRAFAPDLTPLRLGLAVMRAKIFATVAPLLVRLAVLRAVLAKERRLRRAYRTEFHAQFKSYRAFKRHFEDIGRAEVQRKAADPFVAACQKLGLPEGGQFTESAFKTRYRDLIRQHHPDRAGATAAAAEINAAASIIRKRKEWR